MKKFILVMLSIAMLLPALTYAQSSTTGAFGGAVVDSDGKAMPGVMIKAVHVPTGTIFRTITNELGQFAIQVVKVGGPYKVTAELEGFTTGVTEGIYVKLGEKKNVKFMLNLATIKEADITVTASSSVINSARTGAAQNVSSSAIENLPTVGRDISSFTRMAPQMVSGEASGSFSAGGRSSRYNNIQIDGAQNNDLFGLSDSGTPGGQTSTTPVSMEAIEEFQIVMAPYDIKYGGFTGGGVNVVTKSGTNKMHGSAFFYGRNESLVRKGDDMGDLSEFSEFNESTYGLSLGGPIMKNKLFYFLSFEQKNEKSQKDLNYVIDGSGSPVDYGHLEDAQRFTDLLNGYGYDPGSFGPVSNDFKSTQFLIKLDWNLSENHRLSLRNNYVKAEKEILRRTSAYSFNWENSGYLMESTSNSLVLQLNSNFGTNKFNELVLNYTTIRDNRGPLGEDFPNIFIDSLDFYAGSESYSTKNQLDQDIIEITDNFTLNLGKHTLTIGTHNEFYKFMNIFVKRAFGAYYFDDLDAFEAGNAYRFRTNVSLTGDPNAPAEFPATLIGLYVGDEWQASANLVLTLGIRADIPLFSENPIANPAVLAAFGVKTDQAPSGNIHWAPRFGFNYDLPGDVKGQIRGGTGIFTGRVPMVWISNQFGNTGMTIAEFSGYGNWDFIADPNNQHDVSGSYAPAINLADESFMFPQIWRSNLAIDRDLPFGFTGTVEFLYTKNINEIKYENLNIAQVGTNPVDGRPLYSNPSGSRYYTSFVDRNFYHVINLTNASQGYSYSLSFQLQKELKGGGLINMSYTNGAAYDTNSGNSSQAVSNWGYRVHTGDPNNAEMSISDYSTAHRFVLAVVKKFNLIPNSPTTVSFFYEGRSGRPFSYIYQYDINGDGYANDSIYVPANESDIILTDGSWADLDKYISDDPALDAHRGEIAPRNIGRDPWFHKVDFRLAQDIKIPGLKGQKIELSISIENLLNLFNKEWGYYRYIQYNDSVLRWRGNNADGIPTYSFNGDATTADARYNLNQEYSRWRALVGIKYKF